MKILLTLDYELFLGHKTGSVENSLINPMNALLQSVKEENAHFTIFVDAAYLFKLKGYIKRYQQAEKDYASICDQLRTLHQMGHDIQLHIHPQWFFSTYDGTEWSLDYRHYKLSDLSDSDVDTMFVAAKELLDEIVQKKTIAFRAGGFSAQPTSLLRHLFTLTGLQIDSSVCPGVLYHSEAQNYDYENCPSKSRWRFENNICQESTDGQFLEVPISMDVLSPVFYWELVFNRLFAGKQHLTYGDGIGIKATSGSIWSRLLHRTPAMATIDGFKIRNLKKNYLHNKSRGRDLFTVLGHPKLATSYSVGELLTWCRFVAKQGDAFMTISDIL